MKTIVPRLFEKKGISAILIFLFVFNALHAQKIYRNYTDNWGKQGYTIAENKSNKIELVFSLSEFALNDVEINKEIMQNLQIKDFVLPNDAGSPDLPYFSKLVAIPLGAKATVNVIALRSEKIQDVNLAPAPELLKDDDNRPIPYLKNQQIYTTNALFPANPVLLSDPVHLRGLDAVLISVSPFQYNPVTKELIVHKDFKLEIEYTQGSSQFYDTRLRSRWWDPILEDHVLNYNSLPPYDYSEWNEKITDNKSTGYEYLIVVPDDPTFIAWADTIKRFRNRQGIKTGVVTTTQIGGNTTSAIESYINNAYNTWTIPPVGVLLMADYGTSGNTINSPLYGDGVVGANYCISDNTYADVNGDYLPEMAFARMTAQNATHLKTMVTKFINYELNPPTDTGFYQHPISALGWQDDRWFQICSEVIAGFWKSQGRFPHRINELGDPANNTGNNVPGAGTWSTATNTSTILNYFGPSGLNYIPLKPGTLGGFSGGTAAQVNAAINSGSFMLQHRDHGLETGWGEPYYRNNNISGLTNINSRLPYIFSCNCLTGKFNHSSECFAEKFHRYTYGGQNSGCVGILAATEVSYSFVNDAYTWGLYDNMWPNFMPSYGTTPAHRGVLPAFGNSAGKHFLYQSSWPAGSSVKPVTYHLFHHHGDAFMTIYTQVPQAISITHPEYILSNQDTVTITAQSGALVALSVDDEIIGVATGTGASMDIAIPYQIVGKKIVITATQQDYLRYENKIEIYNASAPYIVLNSFSLNDSIGNNNQLLDYEENANIGIQLKNKGLLDASNINVTLQSTDDYVTITDSIETITNIDSLATVSVNNAFTIVASALIPNNHTVNFTLKMVCGDSTWYAPFDVIAYAPVLQIGSYKISNDANNNERLDLGETADVVIDITNVGGALCNNPSAFIEASSPYLIINSNSTALSPIGISDTANAIFNVTANAATTNYSTIPVSIAVIDADTTWSQQEIRVGTPPEIIIGTGTNSSSFFPFYTYSENNKSQMLYKGSEIGAGLSSIKKIGFDFNYLGTNVTSLTNLSIKMKKVNTDQFNSAFIDMSGATEVFSAATYQMPSATGWHLFDIADFNFTGPDSNLVVEVLWGDNGATSTFYYRINATTYTGFNGVAYGYSNTSTPPAYNGVSTLRPNIKFVLMDDVTVENYTITFKVVDGATQNAISNAIINMGSTIKTVNANGFTTIDLNEGTYLYDVEAAGYNGLVNQSLWAHADDTLVIQLSTLPLQTITFTVLDSVTNNPIENAQIMINNFVKNTNSSGVCVFQYYQGSYTYDAFAYEHLSKANQPLIVDGDENVMVILKDNIGIVEIATTNVSAYPNPANNKLWIKSDVFVDHCKILDLHGKLIKEITVSEKSFILDVQQIQSGIYFLQLLTEKGNVMKKISIIK